MPKLSLYKEHKSLDYMFIDKQISEMFRIGAPDVYVHKFIGVKNPSIGTADKPIYDVDSITNIQDLLLLENRDRKYDPEIYRIRGIYRVEDIDFNLSQFGLFIDNDTLYLTVHINDFIKIVGRKPISGDVLELPNLKDDYALNDGDVSLPRYYAIDDVGRAAEGFSATWYPHLYRLRMTRITSSQQFTDICNVPIGDDADKFAGEYNAEKTYYNGEIVRNKGILYTVIADTLNNEPPNATFYGIYTKETLCNLLSTKSKELEINDAIIKQAEADAKLSGYQTAQFFTLAIDPETGKPALLQTDNPYPDASDTGYDASIVNKRATKSGYAGYLVGDGLPPNGYDFGYGIQFPADPPMDSFYLRTDFIPNRLFRFNGTIWVKVEDSVRMDLTNTNIRNTQKTGFINNTSGIYFDKLATDFIPLTYGATIIQTNIDYMTAPYLVIKVPGYSIDLSYTLYPDLYEIYIKDTQEKLQINLPMISGTQLVIPSSATWTIELYNTREEQRQSLSSVLRPKADL